MLSRQGPHWPASPRLLCIMHLAICLRGRAGACSNGIFGAPFVSDMVSSIPPAPHLVHRRCPFAGHHAHRPLCPSPTAAVRIMHIWFFTVQTRNDERAVQVLYGRRASLRGSRSGPACLGRKELTLGQQARGRARADATGRLTQAPGCRWGQSVQWVHIAQSRNSQSCVTLRGI